MAFIPVPNVVQANLRMTVASQQVENTLYFRQSVSEVDAENMFILGEDLIGWWTTSYSQYITDAVELREVYLTDLTSRDGPTVTVTPTGGPLTGLVDDAVLPNNCALCVSFRTGKRGRSFRGRNYVPGLGEGSVVSSFVEPNVSDGLRSAYVQLLIPTTLSAGWDWVVVSRFENGQPRAVGEATEVTSVVLTDRTIDSQRRRLPGRGN